MTAASSVGYDLNWDLLKSCLLNGLKNLPATLELTVLAMAISLTLGMLVALARFYQIPVLSQFLRVLLILLKGTPAMLMLMIIGLIYSSNIMNIIRYFHWNVQPTDINKIFLGVAVLALFTIPGTSEAFRGALLAIEKVQFEAGYSVGLTTPQLLNTIIIPQVIPTAMPMLMNLLVAAFKASALVYTIGIVEVMYGSLQPCAQYYQYLEGYIAAALIFWALSILMTFAGNRVAHAVRIEKS
jgi:L-cystine transport system permease protein